MHVGGRARRKNRKPFAPYQLHKHIVVLVKVGVRVAAFAGQPDKLLLSFPVLDGTINLGRDDIMVRQSISRHSVYNTVRPLCGLHPGSASPGRAASDVPQLGRVARVWRLTIMSGMRWLRMSCVTFANQAAHAGLSTCAIVWRNSAAV